jgi:hypothetical protein
MGLTLRFRQSLGNEEAQKGPFDAFRLEREAIRAAPSEETVAQHRDHNWHVDGRNYFRLDCEGPVEARLEHPSGEASMRYGPFAHFSSADGVAYADHRVFANFDEARNAWYCYSDGRYWPIIELSLPGSQVRSA